MNNLTKRAEICTFKVDVHTVILVIGFLPHSIFYTILNVLAAMHEKPLRII